MRKKTSLKIGDEVKFNSGNFSGLTGTIINNNILTENSIHGFLYKVKLSNGNFGYIEKSEHWDFLNAL